MKRRLTIRFLLCNMAIFYIAFFVYVGLNQIFMRSDISKNDNLYNNNFSIPKVMDIVLEDIERAPKGHWVSEDNIKFLRDNRIWIQILDESNYEVYSLNKPENMPKEYMAGELVRYTISPWKMPSPAVISSSIFERNEEKYSLIIAFPADELHQYTLNFTNESIKFHISMMIFTIIIMIVIAYLFSSKLAKPIADIVEDIGDLKEGKYESKNKKKRKSSIYNPVTRNIEDLGGILKKSKDEAERNHKAKEQWIANIAHDLKNPLSAVSGYGQILSCREYELDSDEVNNYGDIIIEKIDCMKGLIDDLSLIYKIKNRVLPLNFREENIVDILRECIIDILNNPQYEERDIRIEYETEKVFISCDVRYIKRAFENFIYNALKHNPNDTKIEVFIKKNKESAVVEIKDNGQGISEEGLKVLFERYYRGGSSNQKEGTGLGMAISKEIIESHGGTIEVNSKLTEGTDIIVEFKV